MNNDIRYSKNVRERPVKELVAEAKQKEKQQKEISKSHKQANIEEKRREKISKLKSKYSEQKALLQEKKEVARQKAELKRLRQETSYSRHLTSTIAKIRAKQQQRAKKTGTVPSGKPKKTVSSSNKIYFIDGKPYHYKGGKMVKVPVGSSAKKKKKEEFFL